MAISYEEALATLQSMFSDQGYTAQQLDAVLRHHGGHMENTVETLLSHGERTPDELMQMLPSLPVGGSAALTAGAGDSNAGGVGNAAHDIDADEELARQLAAEDERRQPRRGGGGRSDGGPATRSAEGGASGMASVPPSHRRPAASSVAAPARPVGPAAAAAKPSAGTKGRGAPTVLPSDFLRIPGRKYPAPPEATSGAVSDSIASAPGAGGAAQTQMMSDEQLARMLQDELFQEELRNNPEFSHLAGRRNPSHRAVAAGRPGEGRAAAAIGQTTGRSTYGAQGGGGDFFDQLSDLGDTAKRRFQDFAKKWNDPNAQTSRRPLFGGGAQNPLFGGGAQSPLFGGGAQTNANNRPNERRGLLSNDLDMEEEEEEMDFMGGASDSGRTFEMNDVGGSSAKVNWSGDKKKD